MIAVTFSLPSESSDFVALLEGKSREAFGQGTIGGRLGGREVCVVHIGVGERETRRRLGAFLGAQRRPAALISAGFAGALNDAFAPAELLLGAGFSSPQLLEAARTALNALSARVATLVTINSVVDSADARRELAATRVADAADMETQYIAELCEAAGVPMLSLRAVSDTPSAPFPAPAEVLFDVERQRTPVASLLLHIACRPATIGGLIRFARQIATTRRALAQALAVVIQSDAFREA